MKLSHLYFKEHTPCGFFSASLEVLQLTRYTKRLDRAGQNNKFQSTPVHGQLPELQCSRMGDDYSYVLTTYQHFLQGQTNSAYNRNYIRIPSLTNHFFLTARKESQANLGSLSFFDVMQSRTYPKFDAGCPLTYGGFMQI